MSNNAAAFHYAEKDADYYDSTREEATTLVDPQGLRVLDVGCGSGVVGASLKRAGAREVVGIEYAPDAARRAALVLDRVLTGDVDTLPLDFAPGSFDLMLCLDVLEHLPYPEATLNRLLPFLSAHGTLLVSLPNMRYAGTLKKLIFEADWPRLPSGIFDGTHLRWFTDKSARRMFAEAGLEVVTRRRVPLGGLNGLLRRAPFLRPLLSDWVTVQLIYVTRLKREGQS